MARRKLTKEGNDGGSREQWELATFLLYERIRSGEFEQTRKVPDASKYGKAIASSRAKANGQ